jgi:hypothetical protein
MAPKNGFLMLDKNGLNVPAMACECCGETIRDYKMARVVWNSEDEPRSPVMVVCTTNDCMSADSCRTKLWMPLGDYVLNIIYNTGLKTQAKLLQN